MSLLVALHSPAIGYCVTSESYFVGDHAAAPDSCEHHCDDHQSPPEGDDLGEHEHLLVSLDAGDFQWIAAPLGVLPRFIEIEWAGWSVPLLFAPGKGESPMVPPAIPPPPEEPIFRRDAALRV